MKTSTPQTIAAVLEDLTEQTSVRMLNMKLAPEITAVEIQELEKQADTPKDAACKLAIALFKSGVLKK